MRRKMKMRGALACALAACGAVGAQVLAPWTPVKATADAVETWGRAYAFASNVLPTRIVSQGRDLLAAPIRVVCAGADGADHVWTKAGSWVQAATDEAADVCGHLAVPDVFVNATTRIEYDGMAKVALAVMPGKGSSRMRNLSKVWLEIPLRPEAATLFCYSPCSWAKLENVGAVKGPMAWPFRCSVWLGNEDVGLCWFCESDEQLAAADPNRVVEVIPGAAETVLRVHLADGALTRPTTWTFGLQATPTKPFDRRLMTGQTVHAPPMGAGIPGLGVKRPEVWWTCQRAFPQGNAGQVLAEAARGGVKTVVFHEDWIPIQNNPSPRPDFKGLVDACHRLGLKVLVYLGYELSPLDPLWGACEADCLAHDARGNPVSYWDREPAQRDYRVCYNNRFADIWLARAKKAYVELGLDGFYLDGTVMPRACANAAHGCGWTDAAGRRHVTYPIFAVREMMRALYAFVDARGGRIDAHQSGYVCPATLAFAHSYWDGEQLAVSGGARDIKAELDLASFRAEFMGRNHGLACEFLAYQKPGWQYEDALAISLLHGVMTRPCGFANVPPFTPIWKAYADFGTADAAWRPYWAKEAVACDAAHVKVSAYEKPDGALWVVSNVSPTDAATACLALPPGCRAARDAKTGEALPVAGGSLTLALEPFRYRLVRLWKE